MSLYINIESGNRTTQYEINPTTVHKPSVSKRTVFFITGNIFFAYIAAEYRKSSIFAVVNVDRFVMIATTVKNAKAIFYSTFILKSVTFGTIFN